MIWSTAGTKVFNSLLLWLHFLLAVWAFLHVGSSAGACRRLTAAASPAMQPGPQDRQASVAAAHRPQSTGSVVVANGLNWCMAACGSSWIEDRTRASCLGKRILCHRASREASLLLFFALSSTSPACHGLPKWFGVLLKILLFLLYWVSSNICSGLPFMSLDRIK